MSTSYAHTIADGQNALIFFKLLSRWKGSLYKLLWIDLLVYVGMFYLLHALYRALNIEQKRNFEDIVVYTEKMKTSIPLSFLLGFFVAGVVERWWKMYMAIPWLNRMAFLADGAINGQNPDQTRKVKMTLMRYLLLSWILLMRQISKQIQERFSKKLDDSCEEYSVREILVNFNRDRKIQATFRKIITDSEIRTFEKIAAQNFARNNTKYVPEYWIPLQWASRVLQKSLLNGYIVDMRTTVKLIEELDNLRNQMHQLRQLCSIMIPLVYTQVVIIAVYSYFLCQLFSSQFIVKASEHGHKLPPTSASPISTVSILNDTNSSLFTANANYASQNAHNAASDSGKANESSMLGRNIDFFFYPLFTVFQFLFIMGWLKVAICLLNPFGDAQEDFRTSEILDSNLDICWRCATTELCSFPEFLTPATFKFRGGDSQYTDSFHNFIESVEDDLEEIQQPLAEHDVVALEMKPSTCMRIKRCICARCCGYDNSLYFNSEVRTNKVSKSRTSSIFEDSYLSNEPGSFKNARSLPVLNDHSSSSYGDVALGSNIALVSRTLSRPDMV